MAKADDVYLDDRERSEQVIQWWKDNGLSIVGGAVLGLAAIFGWRAWQDHVADHRSAAAKAYQDFITQSDSLSAEQIGARLAMFKSDFSDTPYAAMAALEAAGLAYQGKQPEQAVEYYRYAIAEGKPQSVSMIAATRLARLQMDQGRYDGALATLNGVIEPGAFAALIAELKGDIYVQQGAIDQARTAYARALQTAEPAATRFLELKISALGSGIVAPAETES